MRYNDDWEFDRIDKSRPPLRWLANALGAWGGYHIRQAFIAQEDDKVGLVKFHSFMFNKIYPAYQKWGTSYKLRQNIEE